MDNYFYYRHSSFACCFRQPLLTWTYSTALETYVVVCSSKMNGYPLFMGGLFLECSLTLYIYASPWLVGRHLMWWGGRERSYHLDTPSRTICQKLKTRFLWPPSPPQALGALEIKETMNSTRGHFLVCKPTYVWSSQLPNTLIEQELFY